MKGWMRLMMRACEMPLHLANDTSMDHTLLYSTNFRILLNPACLYSYARYQRGAVGYGVNSSLKLHLP